MLFKMYFTILCYVSVVASTPMAYRDTGCKGDPNAKFTNCPSYCPRTCDNANDGKPCMLTCAPPGCICNTGYILSTETGKCIKPEECPPKECKGDPNAVYSYCRTYCPRTCLDSDVAKPYIAGCAPPGWACKPGYIISHETGKCVKPEHCPPRGCKGDPNAVHSDCPSYCPRTCNSEDDQVCIASCAPPGCVCIPGYVISDETGKCVKQEKCPPKGCQGDPNAVYSKCPTYCPLTCDQPDLNGTVCVAACAPSGCVCMSGYLLDKRGKCVRPDECPDKVCKDVPNAIYKECPSLCPLTCDETDRNGMSCLSACAPAGCVCKSGYVLDESKNVSNLTSV